MTELKDEVFKEPFYEGFDENTYRMRRNLIVSSSISLLLVWFNLKISETTSLGFFSVEGLSNRVVYTALFFVTLYNLGHFFVVALSYFLKWRISVTGRNNIIDFNFNEINVRQATLYLWWVQNRDTLCSSENPKITENAYDNIRKSLERFDNAFWLFQKWQFYRWVLLEIYLPIVLGIFALVWLSPLHF